MYRATPGPPLPLAPQPTQPPVQNVCFGCGFVLGLEWGGGGRGGGVGCPQPFPWLLCVWVIIIFVTIPNQIRLQDWRGRGHGGEESSACAVRREGSWRDEKRMRSSAGLQVGAQDSPPSIFTADQLPRCLRGTWEWKQGVGAALPLPAMYCELQRGRWASRRHPSCIT